MIDAALPLLWGKSDPTGQRRYPLTCHLLDTIAVAQTLLQTTFAWAVARFAAALDVPTSELVGWLGFLAGCHDTGKAAPTFQRKNGRAQAELLAAGLRFPAQHPLPAHHGLITARVLDGLLRSHAWPSAAGPFPAATASRVSRAVGAHHGELPSARLLTRISPDELGDAGWDAVRAALLDCLCTAAKFTPSCVPTAWPDSLYAFLAGLAAVADWLASSEEHFPPEPAVRGPEDHFPVALDRAAQAIRALGFWRSATPTPPKGFELLFGDGHRQPRPLQAAVLRLAAHADCPYCLLVEAPMGEGKTEAALLLHDDAEARLGHQGAYVALPTQATSNQMFRRVAEYLLRRGGEAELHLLHGQAAALDAYATLLAATAIGETSEESVQAHEWFTRRKRGLLAPVAVGTVDQALLAVLQSRHFFVRLFGLANKVVVLDEIHAYDVYMSRLLDRLLAWLAALGCSVILLSATLPSSRRQALLAAYAGTPEVGVPAVPYPRLVQLTGGAATATMVPTALRPRTLRLVRLPAPEAALDLVIERLAAGGAAAIIVNTVARAQHLFARASGPCAARGIELSLLHARFPQGERRRREEAVIADFGPTPRPPGVRRLLIATQIVEQSLDLDFDLLITDLAPIDLVLQRAGRLHRHEWRERPAQLQAAMLGIVQPAVSSDGVPDFGPSAFVYAPYVLLRSWLALACREVVAIPADIEPLIVEVYEQPDPPALPAAIGEALTRSRLAFEHQRRQEQAAADRVLIRSPRDEDGFLEQPTLELAEDQPDLHASLQALTRLAAPSVQLVCLHRSDHGLRLDHGGDVELDCRPDLATARRLLDASISVSHRDVYRACVNSPPPPAWRTQPLLRYARAAIFEDGELVAPLVPGFAVRLDPALGLTVQAEDREEAMSP